MNLQFNGRPVIGFGAPTSEAAVCPPGSSPVFDAKTENYKCLQPDGTAPIRPPFGLTPAQVASGLKCGDGMVLRDNWCYDPRDLAMQAAAGKTPPLETRRS